MGKKNVDAKAATVDVAALAAELSESAEKLTEFIENKLSLEAKVAELEESTAQFEATIADLIEKNEQLEKAGSKQSKTTVKIKGKAYEMAVPRSYQNVNGEMVLVDAAYLAKNAELAEKLLKEESPILKLEE
jgi:hypothetical protein